MMGKNFSRRSFRRDGTTGDTFVVPAGVTTLKVSLIEKNIPTQSFAPTIDVDKYGSVWSWGFNANGQVGDATTAQKIFAIRIDTFAGFTPGPWKAPYHRSDGQMINMGLNTYGQLGDNSTIPKSTPTLVSGGHIFKQIKRGSTCYGLTEGGDLYAWGNNAHGQLGDNTVIPKSTPTLVTPGTKYTEFWTDTGVNPDNSNSPNSIWAKDTSGQLWAWGRDFQPSGQLGNGAVGSVSTPTLVTASIDFIKIVSPSVGIFGHTLGLTSGGDIYAWGNNLNGQLGDNTIVAKSTPTLVIGGFKFKDVGAGSNSSMGLSTDGTLYTWGDNSQGQLGQGNIFPKSSPVVVTGSGFTNVGIRKAYLNYQTMYCIDADRKLFAWGFQDVLTPLLGDNTTVKKSVPTLVFSIGSAGIVETVVEPLNNEFVHVLTSHGIRYAWGINAGGNLGINSAVARTQSPNVVTAALTFGQVQVTGNWFPKMPGDKVTLHTVDVTPGTTLNIKYQRAIMSIPELGIDSSQFCEQVDLEWLG